jgi:hypothetical protein
MAGLLAGCPNTDLHACVLYCNKPPDQIELFSTFVLFNPPPVRPPTDLSVVMQQARVICVFGGSQWRIFSTVLG